MARVLGVAALVLLLLPQGAPAWWHRHATRVAAHYYPVPVYPAFVACPPVAIYSTPVPPPAPPNWSPASLPAVPATPVPPAASTPAVPTAPNFAQPSTAPPSSGLAPYPSQPKPSGPTRTQGLKPIAVAEHYFDSYVVAPPEDGPVENRVRQPVSFWNLSGHNAIVRVNGQNRTLPAGKRMELVLGRQFVWQLDGREPQAGKLADNGAGLDIVIRR